MAKLVKKKFILVDAMGRDSLIAQYGVTRATVYNALNYRTDSEQAQNIRRSALEQHGGQVTYKSILVHA